MKFNRFGDRLVWNVATPSRPASRECWAARGARRRLQPPACTSGRLPL